MQGNCPVLDEAAVKWAPGGCQKIISDQNNLGQENTELVEEIPGHFYLLYDHIRFRDIL